MEETKEDTKIESAPPVTPPPSQLNTGSGLMVLGWVISVILFMLVIVLAVYSFQIQKKCGSEEMASGQPKNKPQTVPTTANGFPTDPQFKVIVPGGGESFCLEQPNEISWTVPPGVETVVASLDTSVSFNRIGEFPAVTSEENGILRGKALWNMKNSGGFDVEAGDVYKITLTAKVNGKQITASSDKIFSIKRCQAQQVPTPVESQIPPQTNAQIPLDVCTKDNSCKMRTPGSAFRCNEATIYAANGRNICECAADCEVVKK